MADYVEARFRRSPGRRDAWLCQTTIAGCDYTATSGSQPAAMLAAQLIAAGIDPDRPLRVSQDGLRGYLTWPTLAAAVRSIRRHGRLADDAAEDPRHTLLHAVKAVAAVAIAPGASGPRRACGTPLRAPR